MTLETEFRNAGGRRALARLRVGAGGPDAGDGRRARTCSRANRPRLCRATGQHRLRRAGCRARDTKCEDKSAHGRHVPGHVPGAAKPPPCENKPCQHGFSVWNIQSLKDQ